MAVNAGIEVSAADLVRLRKRLNAAVPSVFDEIEKEWRDEGTDFLTAFRADHLQGKPITRSGARRFRNPATPHNILTRISGALDSSFSSPVMSRPSKNVMMRVGSLRAGGGKSLKEILRYAAIHRERMQFDDEFKRFLPTLRKSVKKALGKA
jgi:hypothetical protein